MTVYSRFEQAKIVGIGETSYCESVQQGSDSQGDAFEWNFSPAKYRGNGDGLLQCKRHGEC